MDNIMDTASNTPTYFDYKFTKTDGEEIVSHGYLIVNSSFAATAQGGDVGHIQYFVPLGQLKSVALVPVANTQASDLVN